MALQLLRDCKLYWDGYDISGNSNKVELNYEAEEKEKTTFASGGFKERISGLLNAAVDVEGFWEVNAASGATYKIDDIMAANLGVVGNLLTICPTDGQAGELAFCIPGMLGKYKMLGQVGEIAPFSFSASGTDILARGTIMENGQKSATAAGTARQLGAVLTGQKLYAGLHIIAVEGTNPTLNLTIQSATLQAFGTPTTRITFAQQTSLGAVWATPVVGPITDTWWRANWTIGGTGTPKFTFAVILAIQ